MMRKPSAIISLLAMTLLLLNPNSNGSWAQELISDVTTSGADEKKALEVKAEQFWSGVLRVAESAQVQEHAETFERVEKVIASLPEKNSHVKGLLEDALARLRRADRTVFLQRLEAEKLSLDSLEARGAEVGEASGFGAFGAAVRRFVSGEGTHKAAGQYPEQLRKQVLERQEKIMPLLAGTAKHVANVLEDCRLATKTSFDVRKYDIYNRGVPKTPQEADDAADELIKVSGEVRKSFTALIIGTVKSIAADAEGKAEKPAVTLVKSAVSKQQNLLLQNRAAGIAAEENLINL